MTGLEQSAKPQDVDLDLRQKNTRRVLSAFGIATSKRANGTLLQARSSSNDLLLRKALKGAIIAP